MSYLVLARKYRPVQFDEVKGQSHVVRTLKNSISRGKIAHAYLFCGPRGVGKTSIARILSKALNAEGGPSVAPDPEYRTSKEIDAGSSLAVREIDGASHNSVDNVRELIESFRSAPPPGYSYKVYIIDEVHMLSNAAFNALLKSLEEPPPNTVFILATTEPHKIPDTVISRCQRFDFRALAPEQIAEHLGFMCERERMSYEEDALALVARLAEGSLRDSQSLLDRVLAFCDGEVTYDIACDALGTVSGVVILDLMQQILDRDSSAALSTLAKVFSGGSDPSIFLRHFVASWRELLLAKFAGSSALSELGVSKHAQGRLSEFAERLSSEDVQSLVQLAREGADRAHRSSYLRYSIEALIVRMSSREPVMELAEIAAAVMKSAKTGAAPVNKAAYKAPVNASPRPAAPKVEASAPKAQSEASASPNGETVTADRPSAVGGSSSFEDFVSSLSGGSNLMLIEQLKRVSCKSFDAEKVELSGPSFVVDYFERPEIRQKLMQLLCEALSVSKLSLSLLREESNSSSPNSIADKRKREEEQDKFTRIREVMGSSKVQAIKKAFPGSEVGKVILKDKS